MNRKPAVLQQLNLIPVYFDDESETSPDWFQISNFPLRLTSGKNLFKLRGHPTNLKIGANIDFEVLDYNGDPIYAELVNYIDEDDSRIIAIYIYEDTSPGDCTITIIGSAADEFVTEEWIDRYNVKWSRTVAVNPGTPNVSEIIFDIDPEVTVAELIAPQLNRTYANNLQTASYSTGTVRYFNYNEQPALELSNGFFTSDMSNGTITVSNPVLALPAIDFVVSSSTYVSTIKKILTPTTALLNTAYQVTDTQNILNHTYNTFALSSYALTYEATPIYTPTQNSHSFLDLQINKLEPATGDISRIKVFSNNSGTIGTWELINDIELEKTEIFETNTGSIYPIPPIGVFNKQDDITDFWEGQAFAGTTILTNPTLTYTTASILNAMTISSSIDLSNKNTVLVAKIKSAYAGTFAENSSYKLTLDAAGTKTGSESPVLSIYVSGSSFYQDPTDYFNQEFPYKFGKRIGELQTLVSNQKFNEYVIDFEADYSGTGVLILVVESGNWHVSNIHVTSNNDPGFSPNYTRIKSVVSTTHKSNNQLSFKVEYYNVQGEKSKYISYVNDNNWEGGNHYIDGDFSMITGSVWVGNSLGTGLGISGNTNSGHVISSGYQGFDDGIAGFLMWSGSALPGKLSKEDPYSGVGLELYQDPNNYFRYSTSDSELDIRTKTFFLGSPSSSYIAGFINDGGSGSLIISSSNFVLDEDGDVLMAGTINATAGVIGGFTINSGYLFNGDNFYLHGNASGDDFFISSSKFNVKASGDITGSSVLFDGGKIGGFTIDSSKITGTNIVIDSAGSIQTSDYASDLKGWKISAAGNGAAEFENAKIRGTLSTAVFEKTSVNAVGGQLYVANSTTLTGSGFAGASTNGNYTPTQTTMSVENVTGFESGEILTAKKFSNTGFATEYMRINSASRDGTGEDLFGRIYVTRAYGNGLTGISASLGEQPSAGQSYSGSQVIVSTGKQGTGFIRINANPNDTATPYIDIVERTGSGIYDVALKARLGDLSGLANSSYVFGKSDPGFGLATDNVFLQGGIIANTGSIGGINMASSKLFTGTTGTYNDASTGFYLDDTGQFSLKDKLAWNGITLIVSGTINATAGNIGGFAITQNAITGSGVLISGSATGGTQFFISSSKFNVKGNGDVTGSKVLFTGGKIGGFTISDSTLSNSTNFYISGSATGNGFFISSSKFNVKANGDVTASSALFTGTINATSGKIAGFTINDDTLFNSPNFYISGSATGNGFFISSSKFNVKANGDVTASSVLFSGGTIAGINMASSKLFTGTTGTYNDASTGFYLDDTGQFSLKDKLAWDGTTLSIVGQIQVSNGSVIPGSSIYQHGPLTYWPRINGMPPDDQTVLPNASWISQSDSAIEYVMGPYGTQELAITCYPDSGFHSGDGGFISNPVPIDSGSAYMFVVYMKRTKNSEDGDAYFGLDGYAEHTQIGVMTNAETPLVNTNPYFMYGDITPAGETAADSKDRWFLHVGYVYPIGSVYNPSANNIVYDLTTGLTASYDVLQTTYTWQTGTTHTLIRAFHMDNAAGDDVSRFQEIARPGIFKMDGTEPTIQSLLSNTSTGGSTKIDGSTITTGKIRSTNWSTTLGSELDLNAGTITLGGSTSPKFNVNASGDVTASSALFSGSVSVTGNINALSGNIGGFAITRDAITGSGVLISGSATGGTQFFISSSKFNVKGNGDVTGSNVLFTGGKIAGFTISDSTLSNGTNFFISGSSTNNGFFISSSNFNVKANGDVTASNALFTGIALADIIRDKTVTITAANSGSYLQTYDIQPGAGITYGTKIVMDGTLGGEIVRRIRLSVVPPYPIADFKLPALSSTAKLDIVLELGVDAEIYDIFGVSKSGGIALYPPDSVLLKSNNVITLLAGGSTGATWLATAGTTNPFDYVFQRSVNIGDGGTTGGVLILRASASSAATTLKSPALILHEPTTHDYFRISPVTVTTTTATTIGQRTIGSWRNMYGIYTGAGTSPNEPIIAFSGSYDQNDRRVLLNGATQLATRIVTATTITLETSDSVIVCNHSSGTCTISLTTPTDSDTGRIIRIINRLSGTVTLTGAIYIAGSATADASRTTSTQYATIELFAPGNTTVSGWIVLNETGTWS